MKDKKQAWVNFAVFLKDGGFVPYSEGHTGDLPAAIDVAYAAITRNSDIREVEVCGARLGRQDEKGVYEYEYDTIGWFRKKKGSSLVDGHGELKGMVESLEKKYRAGRRMIGYAYSQGWKQGNDMAEKRMILGKGQRGR